MNTKVCNSCNLELDLSYFHKSKATKSGLCGECKDCGKERKRKQYLENREEILAKSREKYARGEVTKKPLTQEQRKRLNSRIRQLRREDPTKFLLSECRGRAKEKGIDFSITLDDLVYTGICPILHTPLTVGNGKLSDNSPTIDRLDNSLGYVKGNVWIVSYLANRMKSSATKEQLIKFADFVYETYDVEKEVSE